MPPVAVFSITTSEAAASALIRSRPSGVRALTPSPSFDRLDDAKDGPISVPVMTRMKSYRLRLSILMTSAPYSANRRPASTPTAP